MLIARRRGEQKRMINLRQASRRALQQDAGTGEEGNSLRKYCAFMDTFKRGLRVKD